MPGDGAGASLEEAAMTLILGTAVDEVHLGVARGSAARGVDVVSPEVTAIGQSIGDGQVGKVLVPEGHDLALSYEAGELVLACVGKGRELDTLDLGADGGRQVRPCGLRREKVGKCRVGIFAMLVVLEGLERRVEFVMVPDGEVMRVLQAPVSTKIFLVGVTGGFPLVLTLAPGSDVLPSSISLLMAVVSISLYLSWWIFLGLIGVADSVTVSTAEGAIVVREMKELICTKLCVSYHRHKAAN